MGHCIVNLGAHLGLALHFQVKRRQMAACTHPGLPESRRMDKASCVLAITTCQRWEKMATVSLNKFFLFDTTYNLGEASITFLSERIAIVAFCK